MNSRKSFNSYQVEWMILKPENASYLLLSLGNGFRSDAIIAVARMPTIMSRE